MKKLLIAISIIPVLLTGCVSAGEFQYKGGTGLVYTEPSSQCGRNCAQYAKEQAEWEQQQAEIELARALKFEEDMAKERRDLERAKTFIKCQSVVDMHTAVLETRVLNARTQAELATARAHQAAEEKKLNFYMKRCMEKYSN